MALALPLEAGWRRELRHQEVLVSPVNRLTVTPKNLAAHQHFLPRSRPVPVGRGFRFPLGVWTFLSPEGAFYPSPGLEAWSEKPRRWKKGSPERARQTKQGGPIARQQSKITSATCGTESRFRSPFQGLAFRGSSCSPWAFARGWVGSALQASKKQRI
jgi:hypothetical protein